MLGQLRSSSSAVSANIAVVRSAELLRRARAPYLGRIFLRSTPKWCREQQRVPQLRPSGAPPTPTTCHSLAARSWSAGRDLGSLHLNSDVTLTSQFCLDRRHRDGQLRFFAAMSAAWSSFWSGSEISRHFILQLFQTNELDALRCVCLAVTARQGGQQRRTRVAFSTQYALRFPS